MDKKPNRKPESKTSMDPSMARRFLLWSVLGVIILIFLPLALRAQFRKLVGVSLLGIFYSLFLVNLWDRWFGYRKSSSRTGGLRRVGDLGQQLLGEFLPLKAWGVVPCLMQFIFLGLFALLGWFLAPLIYEVPQSTTFVWIREFFQTVSPKFYNFLEQLIYAVDPMSVLRENARQIFTSVNRFFSTIIVPLNFFLFTGIGAALYEPISRLLESAEGSPGESKILNRYSRLFGEYLLFNTIYNVVLSIFFGIVMVVLDTAGYTSFGFNLMLGLLVFFIFGNLLVPGLGTLFSASITVALMAVWQGWLWGLVTGAIMIGYFLADDYAVKPTFFSKLGQNPNRAWDFGVEVMIFGLVILYASFQFVGALLLFPALCFLDAYLQHQHPDLRLWILSPLRTLSRENQ